MGPTHVVNQKNDARHPSGSAVDILQSPDRATHRLLVEIMQQTFTLCCACSANRILSIQSALG